MEATQLDALRNRLQQSLRHVIVPHRNPDGDAMGSTLALAAYLKAQSHTATVISPNSSPEFLHWLPGTEKVVTYKSETAQADELIKDCDLIWVLDFNDISRVGDMSSALENATQDMVMLDHHQEPKEFAKYVYSDTSMSSTCQLLYHFLERLHPKFELTAEMATCIYTGIVTDTGSFKYRSTTSETHRVVAALIDAGAENEQIHRKIYDGNSIARLQLLGTALNNLKVFPDLKTAVITLSRKEKQATDYKKGDTEGFVNYALGLKGIAVAAMFTEDDEKDYIKISFRSKGNFPVNELARDFFEGGGHRNASGGRSDLNMADTVARFRESVKNHFKEHIAQAEV